MRLQRRSCAYSLALRCFGAAKLLPKDESGGKKGEEEFQSLRGGKKRSLGEFLCTSESVRLSTRLSLSVFLCVTCLFCLTRCRTVC